MNNAAGRLGSGRVRSNYVARSATLEVLRARSDFPVNRAHFGIARIWRG
jgi:hypothetical protein